MGGREGRWMGVLGSTGGAVETSILLFGLDLG